jgi:hypothetical protein
MPADPRYPANPDGARMRLSSCDNDGMKLQKVRAAFEAGLKKAGLLFDGHELDGTLFVARLEGRDLCLAIFEILMAGRHHWGRTKRAFVEAVRGVFKRAVEWPGYPPDPHANLAPWRIVVDPPVQ